MRLLMLIVVLAGQLSVGEASVSRLVREATAEAESKPAAGPEASPEAHPEAGPEAKSAALAEADAQVNSLLTEQALALHPLNNPHVAGSPNAVAAASAAASSSLFPQHHDRRRPHPPHPLGPTSLHAQVGACR